MFRQNESALDRVIRLVIGVALGILVFTTLTGAWQIVAAIVAAVMLLTGAVGFCPLYALFRISTKSTKRAQA
jgi:hypothetical protein